MPANMTLTNDDNMTKLTRRWKHFNSFLVWLLFVIASKIGPQLAIGVGIDFGG